jgi:cell volume regulation protein A
MISRSGHIIPPGGSTEVQSGDHVFVVIRPDNRDKVDAVFTRTVALEG